MLNLTKAYPGRILAVVETDVKVECKHSLRNKYETNKFCWPEKVKDICFYQHDDVICLIPQPERISNHGPASNHFRELPDIWQEIERTFK